MNDEPKKRGRPPSKLDINRFLDAIADGLFDEDLARVEGVCKDRRDLLKQKVLDQVHEVFGPDAVVQIPRSGHRARAGVLPRPNPFVDKAQGKDLTFTTPTDTEEDVITPDALADEKLEVINSGEQVPIEMRGAIIGGLSVSDIGD